MSGTKDRFIKLQITDRSHAGLPIKNSSSYLTTSRIRCLIGQDRTWLSAAAAEYEIQRKLRLGRPRW